MRVLIVTSGNSGKVSPFIQDQINVLEHEGIEIFKFLIMGKGMVGYLKNYKLLLKSIKIHKPDVIHAHFGLSGLLAVLQRKVPVVTTFHGCDINVASTRKLSRIANKLGAASIFISENLANKIDQKNPVIIPCGVDLDIFYPIEDRESAKLKMGLKSEKQYILFASSFSNQVKNYPLAKEAISTIANKNIELLELKGYNRKEVALLLNAVDAVLLTSFREGSPQFIKEAMACNCPIVSTDVGDVKEVLNNTQGCFISESNAKDLSIKISEALLFNKRTLGRKNVEEFDNKIIANKIINIYKSIIK